MLPDAFGCIVANRFGELLDDDADPFDLLSSAETEKEEKKKIKKKQDEEDKKKGGQKKPGQKESQKDRRVHKGPERQDQAPVVKQPIRSGPVNENSREEAHRGLKRGAAGERSAAMEEKPQEFSISRSASYADSDFRGRGGVKGKRGARGGGGGGGGYAKTPENLNLRGKREYDRHNGTGISPEEKRGGRGPWNWGCVDESASEFMEVTAEAPLKAEEPQTQVDEANLTNEDEEGEMVVQVAMQMSLDEWKAMQEQSRPKAEFNIRKTDNTIPSKAKVIHQSKHLESLKGTLEEMEDDGHFLRRSVNDITSLLDINFGSLGRPMRGGRGRGARGGGATSRPERPKQMMERVDGPAPNPDDPEDFPALPTGR